MQRARNRARLGSLTGRDWGRDRDRADDESAAWSARYSSASLVPSPYLPAFPLAGEAAGTWGAVGSPPTAERRGPGVICVRRRDPLSRECVLPAACPAGC